MEHRNYPCIHDTTTYNVLLRRKTLQVPNYLVHQILNAVEHSATLLVKPWVPEAKITQWLREFVMQI